MAFAGTIVSRGRAHGLVVRTGASTELGRLVHDTRAVGQVATPLQVTFERFGRRVGVVVLVLAALVLAIGLARHMAPAEIFLTAVALAVSAIPEGLPVVLTVTLAVGVRRMAARHAIIRSLPAVETLGCTTVIGSDKTGTLTRNEMTVRRVWTVAESFELTGVGYGNEGAVTRAGVARDDARVDAHTVPALARTLEIALLANESEVPAASGAGGVGDPTEIALHVAAAKGGFDARALRERHHELDLLPFESERRLMVSLRDMDGAARAHLKGGPEAVLARCDRMLASSGTVPLDVTVVMDAADHMAAEGLRVLALAYRAQRERTLRGEAGDGYVLAGLVGMEDPLRPEAIAAVRDARGAGIRVLMLTGDHAATARTIGRRLGLGDVVMTGQEMAVLPDGELDVALRECSVFARVAPEHKLRVVQRLEAHGEVVAVTGDGANDAPALRAAHLGIATGASGSDVAREAADMVLADDDFATITAAVEEGRIVFANIRKVTFFLLSTAAGEVLAILVTLLAGWPLPFTAAQLLWINLVTDSLQVFALAFEPGEPGLLAQPPRPRDEGVLTPRHFVRLAGIGLLLTAVTLATFWWALDATGDMTIARSAALTQMVVMQFYHSFNCRSLDRSVLTIPPFSNRLLFASTATVALAHIAALHVGVMQRVLGTAPLTVHQWSWILLAGSVVVIGGELDKLLNRWTRRTLG
jgi:Ca2+-transporting ATPase